MMNFKKMALRTAILAVCTVAPMAAHAQGMGGGMGQMSPEQRSARMMEMMKSRLNLTEDQEKKIKDIWAERDKKMMALRDDTSTDMEAKRPKMMEIQKDSSDKVRAVLTDDQKKTYDEMQSQMRGRRGGMGGDAPPPPQQ